MKILNHPYKTDLVLAGGGHSHCIFLKMWGMDPLDSVRVTLISDGVLTPYSGMLPGLIAGDYSSDEAHIDLRQLCEYAGVRFIDARLIGLDAKTQTLRLEGRPPLRYDCLSLNLGSQPCLGGVAGAEDFGIGIKPVAAFMNFWNHLKETYQKGDVLTIVGAGAAGVESALCMKKSVPDLKIRLIEGGPHILPAHNKRVRRIMGKALARSKVEVILDRRVENLREDAIILGDDQTLDTSFTVFTTQAEPPAWLKDSGLALDKAGFIYTNDFLQTLDFPNIFAVGDIASMYNYPRAKSGVFAVRQGTPLFGNLCNYVEHKDLRAYRPQVSFLSLLNNGRGGAVLSRGALAASGSLLGYYKDWIDRRFMSRFQNLNLREMRNNIGLVEESEDVDETIRCHGCAAKVGSNVLNNALDRLDSDKWTQKSALGIIHDDAALIDIPPGSKLLQSIDHLSAFVSDPFVFGQITANHCLSDIYAMGAKPHSALANIIIPYAKSSIMEEDIYQVLEGVLVSFRKSQVRLVGGHTSEGRDLSLGLSVNGLLDTENYLRKANLKAGDKLILTKPLGTGLILAAAMRIKVGGAAVQVAVDSMLKDNFQASRIIYKSGANACTDITGFGLLGHLFEMLGGDTVQARLEFSNIPVFSEVADILEKGINSSLFAQNRGSMERATFQSQELIHSVLVDPQTSGGLLAAVPEQNAQACLDELMCAGYPEAAIIGEIVDSSHGDVLIV